jgi:hypothetical protein
MQCKTHFPTHNPDVLFFKFICRKNNMRLEFNDTVFLVICQYTKEVRNGYKESGLVEAMYFLLNITLIYHIFSYIIFVKGSLTLCTISFLFRMHFVFKTFFTVSKPKATNSRVSDCYLTQNQQFSAISWREQVNFQ